MLNGNGANGAGHDVTQSSVLLGMGSGDNGHSGRMSPEQLQKIRDLLNEPFDPGEIKWRVNATSTRQTQKRGQVVAYADQRAYTDRLNDVFGEWGWTRSYEVQVAQNFERRAPGDQKRTAVAAKVVVVSKVTIHGLGSHTGVGEEWADDQNAATRAEAQAFKRACACFGLGRYLYDLDTVWVDLDQYNRPVRTPDLPEWARPSYTHRHTKRSPTHDARQQPQSMPREEMLSKIRELRQKIGQSLAQFLLKKYAGGLEPEGVDPTTLNTLFEKFIDIGNGVDRLRRAAAAMGEEQYSIICRELNVVSVSIDDIPDRDALQRLVTLLEADSKRNNGHVLAASIRGIGDARGRLLQAARRVAEKTGRRLADLIAETSEGKLSLDGLRDLTDADVPLVSAAISRMS
jgi:hypothetical protein